MMLIFCCGILKKKEKEEGYECMCIHVFLLCVCPYLLLMRDEEIPKNNAPLRSLLSKIKDSAYSFILCRKSKGSTAMVQNVQRRCT